MKMARHNATSWLASSEVIEGSIRPNSKPETGVGNSKVKTQINKLIILTIYMLITVAEFTQ